METLDDGRVQRQSGTGLTTIIGGAGFIGKRLAAQLILRGNAVRVVDIVPPNGTEVDYRSADVRDRDALATALEGSDVVYNLAAVHRDDVRPATLYHDVNVTGATNVSGVCRDLAINRLLFSSSVAIYGASTTDISEEQQPRPSNEYGRSKLLAEQGYRKWQAEAPEQRSLVIVRPSVVFGEGNRGNVYRLLQQVVARRFVMIGTGKNRKSMAYVENLCHFLVHVIPLRTGVHIYNYADKPDLSMEELVTIMRHELGFNPAIKSHIPYVVGYFGGLMCDLLSYTTRLNLPISRPRVRKFCSTTTYLTQRAQATGFRPPIDIRDALRKTIKHETKGRPN